MTKRYVLRIFESNDGEYKQNGPLVQLSDEPALMACVARYIRDNVFFTMTNYTKEVEVCIYLE